MAYYTATCLQTAITQVVPSQDAGVLTIGQISSDTAENIIHGSASFIKINTRADSDELAEKMKRTIEQIMCHQVQAAIVDVDSSSELDTRIISRTLSRTCMSGLEDSAALARSQRAKA